LADVTTMAVKQCLDKVPFGAASKARIRNMMSKLFGLAMLWEYIPVGRNPMELVRTKRILLPVDHLRDWIERNILMKLAIAPPPIAGMLQPALVFCDPLSWPIRCARQTDYDILVNGSTILV